MAYFPELSPYVYDGREPDANVLNVGWLSIAHAFRRLRADGSPIDIA